MRHRIELVRPDGSEPYNDDWFTELEEGFHEAITYNEAFLTDGESGYFHSRVYDRLQASSHRPD